MDKWADAQDRLLSRRSSSPPNPSSPAVPSAQRREPVGGSPEPRRVYASPSRLVDDAMVCQRCGKQGCGSEASGLYCHFRNVVQIVASSPTKWKRICRFHIPGGTAVMSNYFVSSSVNHAYLQSHSLHLFPFHSLVPTKAFSAESDTFRDGSAVSTFGIRLPGFFQLPQVFVDANLLPHSRRVSASSKPASASSLVDASRLFIDRRRRRRSDRVTQRRHALRHSRHPRLRRKQSVAG